MRRGRAAIETLHAIKEGESELSHKELKPLKYFQAWDTVGKSRSGCLK